MSLTRLEYKKTWTSSGDFPTYEDSEQQVREDLQYHPDAIRDYLNGTLLPEVEKEQSTAAEGLQKAQETLERQQEQIEELAFGETPTVIKSTLYRENLLINADFRDPVDTKQGYVVPPGTAYYTGRSQEDHLLAGTTAEYVAVTRDSTAPDWGKIVVGGITYYVWFAEAVRGYAGLGKHLSPWYIPNTNGAVKLNDKSVTVYGGNLNASFFNQKLSIPLAGETVTASLLTADGKLSWASGTFPTETDREIQVASATAENSVTFNVNAAGPGQAYTAYVSVRVPAGAEIDVSAAKLELGDYQTLAHQDENGNWVLNEAPNKAKQLALCSQYDPETGEFYDELLARQSQVEELEGALSAAEEKLDYRVGDMIETYRTDLGGNWALCNGDVFDPTEYPELEAVTPPMDSFAYRREYVELTNLASTLASKAVTSYTEGNGYQVFARMNTTSGGTNYVVSSADGFKTYAEATLGTGVQPIVRYANGHWITINRNTVSGETGSINCWYRKDDPEGAWTAGISKGLNKEVYLGAHYDIWYQDGRYYLAAAANTTSTSGNNVFVVISSQLPGFEACTATVIHDTGNSGGSVGIKVLGFTKTEEHFVSVSKNADGTWSVCYAPLSEPLNYTVKQFSVNGAEITGMYTPAQGACNRLYYADGKLFVLAYTTELVGETTYYYPVVMYTDDMLADEWTSVRIDGISYTAGSKIPVGPPIRVRGEYFIASEYIDAEAGSGFALATDITDPTTWRYVAMDDNTISSGQISQCEPFSYDGWLNLFVFRGIYKLPICTLPICDTDYWYKYIKIKEGENNDTKPDATA